MGGGTDINYPAQPTYGEGMAEAMKAQMEQLLGQGDYADIYKEAGFEGGNLGDILAGVEAPIRKQTAQIDTDVMRQTLLGGEGKTTDQEGRVITGYATPESAGGAGLGGYQIVNLAGEMKSRSAGGGKSPQRAYTYQVPSYGLVDKDGNVVLTAKDTGSEGWDTWRPDVGSGVASLMAQAEEQNLLTSQQAEAGNKAEPIYETDPETGDPIIYKDDDGNVLSGQQLPRTGDGMVDLIGDRRAVQEQVSDYESYVINNPDLLADFNANRGQNTRTIEEYGRDHYEQYGRDEGRELGLTLQDTADQAGFREGQFMGLSALAEDIGRGGQQRAREADIADVERLGGRATDAYRAQGDLSGALAEARRIGAGGSDDLSAIPANPLFGTPAQGNLAERTALENASISAITGGRTGDYDPRALPSFNTSYSFQNPQGQGSAGGGGGGGGSGGGAGSGMQTQGQPLAGPMQGPTQGQYAQPGGTDAFRSALMQQGMGALDQGLTARENRAIQEAARARSTNMGRTFDQTASIKEAEDVIREDNARRQQNRAFAQSALGQEVGIQQADMARGLQAQQLELGRQSAGVDRLLTAEEKDIERAMRRDAMQEQYRQQGLGAERASAVQMVGLEQATSADPFQAILQRQGQNNLGAGGQLFGSAQYGLQSGPQYLRPEAGLGFISNQASNAANMYNAQVGADATRSAGIMGGLGSLAGGLFGGAGAAQGFGKLFS